MRTRVVIQSRLSSSRLPGKALISIGGMPLVELVARRASRSGFEVVVATSVETYDDRIVHHLTNVGIPVVRGPLDDVLSRFVDATRDMDDSDTVVRLTGDNPVADAALVQEIIDETAASDHEYGRVDIEQVPEGLGVEVFSVASLRDAHREAVDSYDREHVTPWIRRNKGEYLAAPPADYGDPTIYRCTTDCLHDYDRVSRLFDGVADPVAVHWRDLITRLDELVQGFGPLAVNVGEKQRLTSILLGTHRIGMDNHGRNASVVREVFAAAVDRGVSHVVLRSGEAPVVATGMLPGLRQRLGLKVLLSERAVSAESVALELETVFAHVGERRAATVFLPGQPNMMASSAWDRLQEYNTAGVVQEIGVLLPPDRLDSALPPAIAVAVELPQSDEIPMAELRQLARSHSVHAIVADPCFADAAALTAAGVVLVAQPADVGDLGAVLLAVAGA